MPTSATKADTLKPRAMRIPAAVHYSGLSRSAIYRLAREQKIVFLKFGSSTLVATDDLDRVLDSLRAA